MTATPLSPSLQCAVPYTLIQVASQLFTVPRSGNRTSHRLFVMLHQSLFWSPNRMDQHVRSPCCHAQHRDPQRDETRMSLQSALMGFLVSKMLPTPLSPQEIIVVQTTAVATGTVSIFRSNQQQAFYEPALDAIGSRVCRHTSRSWSAK